ncbi:MAG: tetratricopeptide repeat protein [Deltaproteobacteria bacterium]|nr:tetratricopeptide repeat protein [Deltaproteobacteria bacterium]MBW2534617.1 tetratricopeptide repeat protein [Deltaproteobacteria bacterium]
MREGWILLSMLMGAVLATASGLGCRSEPASQPVRAEVLRVGPTEVTIAWQTAEPSLGRVRYRQSGAEGAPQTAVEQPPPAQRHELTIRGLRPGTRYQYGIGAGGLERRFATQPLATTPFSALVVWGDLAERLDPWVASEAPELVLSLSPIPPEGVDPFASIRAELPVFGPAGPTSRVVELPQADRWVLDWGGLRLVSLTAGHGSLPAELLSVAGPHTLGLVVHGIEGLDGIRDSALHGEILRHNSRKPTLAVAFVVAPSSSGGSLEADGVVYLAVPARGAQGAAGGALRLDVGPGSTVAAFVDGGREITLRRRGLARRRTCKECRELADRGAYEQSVKAYQEFIATHEGHYQIDDAHYAVAEILDERLFRHAEALRWYDRLVEQYPNSTSTPLARQRSRYLRAHADHDFEPLARFERARKLELARRKADPAALGEVLAGVQQILADFPDCSLAPEIRYWLANQYRGIDADRAVSAYRQLIASHPSFASVEDAHIEIGETYYDAGRYAEAIAAFQAARLALPDRALAIDAQIRRAERNLRRGRLAWGGWIVLVALLGAGLAPRPSRVRRGDLRAAAVAFAIVAALTSIAGWLIHEQFKSTGELLGLSLTISAAASFGYPSAAALARKLWRSEPPEIRPGRGMAVALTGAMVHLIILAAGAYLALFHLNPHYLVTLGL